MALTIPETPNHPNQEYVRKSRNKTSFKASSEALNEALNADERPFTKHAKHLALRRTLQHMIAEDMLQQMLLWKA